jgi:transcription elongation factor S-II
MIHIQSLKIADDARFRQSVARQIDIQLLSSSSSSSASGIEEEARPETSPSKLALNLEKSIYNYAVREADSRKVVKKWINPYFVTLYTDRFRSFHWNWINTASFRAAILSGQMTPQVLAQSSTADLAPEKWRDLMEMKRRKDMSRYQTDQQASTDMFKCGRCGSRRCRHYELQVRSADESCSVYITCLNCNNRWRVN